MKTFLKLATGLIAVTLMSGAAMAQSGGDAKKGERVFKKCTACHMVGDKAKNRVGPVLNGIVGRAAGTAEGYRYSKLNLAAGEAGLVWTAENIIAYLPDPSAYLKTFLKENGAADKAKGRSKMVYKLKKEDERKDVVAYLETFSEPKPTN